MVPRVTAAWLAPTMGPAAGVEAAAVWADRRTLLSVESDVVCSELGKLGLRIGVSWAQAVVESPMRRAPATSLQVFVRSRMG